MKRIMHALRLGKIAAVDNPCQEGALAMITKRAVEASTESYMKRTFSPEKRKQLAESGAALPDGSFPIENGSDLENAIRAIGRAKDPAKAKAHIRSRAKALDMTDRLPDDWSVAKIFKSICDDLSKTGFQVSADTDDGAREFDDLLRESIPQKFFDDFYSATDALRTSISSILQDGSVSDKAPLVTESLQQFADYIEEHLPDDIGKSLAAGFAALAGGAGTTSGGAAMLEALKKALGLSASATEADVIKAAEEKAKKAEEREKDEKRAEKIAKMSEKHKAFMDHPKADLPKGGKDAFADMEPSERDAHIASHPIEDEDEDCEKALKKGLAFKTADGTVFHKKDFGTEAAYNFAKSQAETIAKQAAEIAKATEEKAVAAFEKRATDLGFAREFGSTLRKAYAGDADAQEKVEKEMAALRKQADEGGLFNEIGKRGGNGGTAYQELVAKGEEVRKANPKLTAEQAFSKAYTDKANVDIVKRYKAERANPN